MTDIQLEQTDDALSFATGGVELARYVWRPDNAQRESPRPYLHPLRTLSGELVSLYRPHDHVWHKGISLALPNVSEENFWGGATYVRGQGYTQLPNNGTQVHLEFEELSTSGDTATVTESLRWDAQQGSAVLTERRRFGIRVLADAWVLDFETALTNVAGRTLEFGSPTTEGRENAGYAGLFWRGPRSFDYGQVLADGHPDDHDMMGERSPWLAYVGKHDEVDAVSTVVFVDDNRSDQPTKWFVRVTPYACVCPAPFFDEVTSLPDSETLTLRYRVFVASGGWDRSRIERAVAESPG